MTHAKRIFLVVAAFAALFSVPAQALELRLDGYHRVRGRVFDTLSVSSVDDEPLAEGAQSFVTHRLRLTPQLKINPYLSVFAQADLFDIYLFGQDGVTSFTMPDTTDESGNPWTGPPALSGSVLPGSGSASGMVKRAWLEANLDVVPLRLRIGRMPNHWGAGLVYNDGEDVGADYGDSVDRLELSLEYKMLVVRATFDTWAENFQNVKDDIHGVTASVGYLGEVFGAGLMYETRWTYPEENKFNANFVDLWGQVRLGPLSVELEAALQWGKGVLPETGFDEVSILAGGGSLNAELSLLEFHGGFDALLASGDKDVNDAKSHTFVIDRDRDIGLLMFEQSMPVFTVDPTVLQDGDPNVDSSRVVLDNAISNAFVISPYVGYSPYDSFTMELRYSIGWTLIKTDERAQESMLGSEINFNASWMLWDALELGGTVAVFFPGKVFDTALDSDSRNAAVFGGELRAVVHFD